MAKRTDIKSILILGAKFQSLSVKHANLTIQVHRHVKRYVKKVIALF